MFCNVCNKYKKSIKKYHIFLKKHYVFLLFTVSVTMNMKKYLKKNNKTKYEKSLV